jgi:hypothetical protein
LPDGQFVLRGFLKWILCKLTMEAFAKRGLIALPDYWERRLRRAVSGIAIRSQPINKINGLFDFGPH